MELEGGRERQQISKYYNFILWLKLVVYEISIKAHSHIVIPFLRTDSYRPIINRIAKVIIYFGVFIEISIEDFTIVRKVPSLSI